MGKKVKIIAGAHFYGRTGVVESMGTGYVFVTFSRNTKKGIKLATFSFPASNVAFI